MNADPAALPSRPSPGAAGAQLGELYTEHARMVLGICRLLLRDPSEAEDATQQVFLSAYRSLLAGTVVEKPGAWLGTIARNESRTRIASRMRDPIGGSEADRLATPGLEEQAIGRERAAELYAELAALPEKQREAVVLRDIYGLRYAEVAQALGTSTPAVEALLFRGRRRLQYRLRPRLVAGVLVVPLAVQESLAYAVPGFAPTASAASAAVAVPLLAKLAAGGVTVVLAGSAGVAVERGAHDRPPPARPLPRIASAGSPPAAATALKLTSAEVRRARPAVAEEEGFEDALRSSREPAELRSESAGDDTENRESGSRERVTEPAKPEAEEREEAAHVASEEQGDESDVSSSGEHDDDEGSDAGSTDS